jgi:hypothetical protein
MCRRVKRWLHAGPRTGGKRTRALKWQLNDGFKWKRQQMVKRTRRLAGQHEAMDTSRQRAKTGAAAAVQLQEVVGHQVRVNHCLRLLRCIAIIVASTASNGSAAVEMEDCIPELITFCMSSRRLDEQHGAMLCLAAMMRGKTAFPNAVKTFLEMRGYGRILCMRKLIAASSSSSLPSRPYCPCRHRQRRSHLQPTAMCYLPKLLHLT